MQSYRDFALKNDSLGAYSNFELIPPPRTRGGGIIKKGGVEPRLKNYLFFALAFRFFNFELFVDVALILGFDDEKKYYSYERCTRD